MSLSERSELFNAIFPEGMPDHSLLLSHIRSLSREIKDCFLQEFDRQQCKVLGVREDLIQVLTEI